MRYRVEIIEEPNNDLTVDNLPKAKTGAQVNYSLFNKLAAIGGADMRMSEEPRKATKTITKVPREAANLEAEGGETVLTFDPVGYPLFYTIKGPRHHSGGVPLNLPDDSFIFSDTKEMIIRDCTILKMFNKPCNKKGFTPAALSKQFDINRYRNILQDPDTDEITRNTAESMIKKYVVKLGALALAQESKKGFPQGIPVVAKAYMDAHGISEDDILPDEQPQMQEGQRSPADQMPPDQYAQEQQPDGMQNVSPDQMDEAQMQQMMMAQQQQGQMPPQQQGAPEGMATPEMVEPMMQQMEQQGPPPMAMYGMSMGGFYPEFAFGGFPMYPGGGVVTVNQSSSTITDPTILKKEYQTGQYTLGTPQQGKTYVNIGDGVSGIGTESGTDVAWSYSGNGGGNWNPTRQEAIDQYCKNMQNPKSKLFYGVDHVKIAEANFGYLKNSKNPKDQAEYAAIVEKLKGCKAGGKQTTYEYVKQDNPPVEDCPVCKDPTTGKDITTGPDGKPFKRVKDANGNCTPCPTTECYCDDENGNQVVVDCSDPCTKGDRQENYYGESIQGPEVPFESSPNYLVYADANMNAQLIGNRGTQLEQYGKDPRGLANQYSGQANALMQAQQKFVANPGASLASGLTAQQSAAAGIRGAYDEANKFNTEVRNNEIGINTAYRKDFLDKLPVYQQSYLDNVARQKENAARFFNEKQAKQYEMKEAKNKYDTEMQWVLANNENVKWAPGRGFYSVKTKDFTPTQGTTDAAQKMKDIMNTYGIEDENVAYKLATAARYGGQYANGGFVYTDNIFPYLL